MNDIPVSTISEQPLDTPPFRVDNTLFDDPVALFDDPNALFGGESTLLEDLKVNIQPNTPSSKIPRYS